MTFYADVRLKNPSAVVKFVEDVQEAFREGARSASETDHPAAKFNGVGVGLFSAVRQTASFSSATTCRWERPACRRVVKHEKRCRAVSAKVAAISRLLSATSFSASDLYVLRLRQSRAASSRIASNISVTQRQIRPSKCVSGIGDSTSADISVQNFDAAG